MRLRILLPLALLQVAVSHAQTVEEKLQWARQTIDENAVTHHFEPPGMSSETKWEVTRIEGCEVELKETQHRETPNTVYTRDGVFGSSDDKVVTWSFDLASLLPGFITADTSAGLPQIRIFADGDAFHLKTDFVSRTVGKNGTVTGTRQWSTPGNARNLWIYFDSPTADNKLLVRRLERDLRSAVSDCTRRKRSR